jgi:hypothetical protein
MPSRRPRAPRLSTAAVALAAALIVVAGLVWFRPYLTNAREAVSGIPAASPVSVFSEFAVPPREQACMSSITVESSSHLARFGLRPAQASPQGGPPVELVLSAPGYRGVVNVPGGYPGGSVTLPLQAPTHSVIGSACFVNRGSSTVLLDGTTEPRTLSRPATSIDGKPVLGDISLAFVENPQPLLDRLGEVFGHASDLTDRLIPVWLIWILAVLVALGVPIGVLAAFYLALREDEAAATS